MTRIKNELTEQTLTICSSCWRKALIKRAPRLYVRSRILQAGRRTDSSAFFSHESQRFTILLDSRRSIPGPCRCNRAQPYISSPWLNGSEPPAMRETSGNSLGWTEEFQGEMRPSQSPLRFPANVPSKFPPFDPRGQRSPWAPLAPDQSQRSSEGKSKKKSDQDVAHGRDMTRNATKCRQGPGLARYLAGLAVAEHRVRRTSQLILCYCSSPLVPCPRI